jgi:hypothetical protein
LLSDAAISKEQETSCDRFALTTRVRALDAALPFFVFAGANKEQDSSDLIKAKLAEIEDFYKRNTPLVRTELLNGSMDASHPHSNIRGLNIIRYAQSLPIIQMKNPILRMAALTTQLNAELETLSTNEKFITTVIARAEKDLSTNKEYTPEQIEEGLKSYREKLAGTKGEIAKTHQTVKLLVSEYEKILNEASPEERLAVIRDVVDFSLGTQQFARTKNEEILGKIKVKSQFVKASIDALKAARAEGANPFVRSSAAALKKLKLNTSNRAGIRQLQAGIYDLTTGKKSWQELRALREAIRESLPFKNAEEENFALAIELPMEMPNAGAGNRMTKVAKTDKAGPAEEGEKAGKELVSLSVKGCGETVAELSK